MTKRLILLIFIPTISFGQFRLNEKFVNDAINENNYVIFNHDSTFKYRLSYELFHDISCGHYKIDKDTIILFYETDLRDTNCNHEIDITNFESSSLAVRPDKLFYKNDRLYKIEKGQVIDRTEKFQPDWKVPKSSRKYYRRKYLLFGPLISKAKSTYYMIVASKAKWTKASR